MGFLFFPLLLKEGVGGGVFPPLNKGRVAEKPGGVGIGCFLRNNII